METYGDVFKELEKYPLCSPEREAAWEELRKPLLDAHVPQTYVYCPVCELALDWAWCSYCKRYR